MTPPDLAAMRTIYNALNDQDIPKEPGGAALFIAETIHNDGLAFTWKDDDDYGLREETTGAREANPKRDTAKSKTTSKADETTVEA